MRTSVATKRIRDASKIRVLLAARELFAQYGYNGVGMRQIATKANTVLHTGTYYFGTKERLYGECIRESLEQLRIAALFARPLAPQVNQQEVARAVETKITEVFHAFFSDQAQAWAAQLMARAMMEQVAEAQEQVDALLELTGGWFLPALRQALPNLSEERFSLWHMAFLGEIMIYAFAQPSILKRLKRDHYDERLLDQATQQITASLLASLGLSASPSESAEAGWEIKIRPSTSPTTPKTGSPSGCSAPPLPAPSSARSGPPTSSHS